MKRFLGLPFLIFMALPLSANTRLSIVSLEPIDSVQPYDHHDGVFSSRPEILDDLVYESLFTKDPFFNSETLHPLIAKSLQWNADFSVLTFDLDPSARFQDGSYVTGDDILFSIEEYKKSSDSARLMIERWISSITVRGHQVSFHLQSQDSRSAIAETLSRIKIIRPNRRPEPKLSGISLNFMGTGAYRIAQLGPAKLVLVKDPYYWARFNQVRQRLFNFASVEVTSYQAEADGDTALVAGSTNFSARGRTQRIESTAALLIAKNPSLVLKRQLNDQLGQPLHSFAFNLQRSRLQDLRVRQALFLAFDFDKINGQLFSYGLVRPSSLLERSPHAPTGLPSVEARALLESCALTEDIPAEVFSDFSNYGTIKYRRFSDDRARLLEASRLLQMAGYRLVNGKLTKADQPLTLKILLRDKWEVSMASVYQTTLTYMGIQTEVVAPSSRSAYEAAVAEGDFDLRSTDENLLSTDGTPEAARYANPSGYGSECIDGLLQNLSQSPAESEALARLHQALSLGIFTGESRYKDYILDQRIKVPDGLSFSKVHIYGFWLP